MEWTGIDADGIGNALMVRVESADRGEIEQVPHPSRQRRVGNRVFKRWGGNKSETPRITKYGGDSQVRLNITSLNGPPAPEGQGHPG